MGDAAPAGHAAQVLEHDVDGASHVEQDRQLELGGKRELGREEARLAVAVEAGDEVVEADLADRDQTRVVTMPLERGPQDAEVALAGTIGAHGMDAEGVRQSVPMRKIAHACEIADIDGRDDDLRDARGARSFDDGVAVGVELGGVEMAMGVDPHRHHDASLCAASLASDKSCLPCYRIDEGRQTRRRASCVAPRPTRRGPDDPMKRVPLYSRSQRPVEPTAELSPAASASGDAATAGPRRSRVASTLLRHERRLWALAVVALAATIWWFAPTFNAKAPMTFEQIEAGVRQSIEDKPLVSPASRAYDSIIPSVVRVVGLMTEGDDGSDGKEAGSVERGIGTGVVIIDNGTILTNLHVVAGAKKVRVTFFDGSESEAVVLSTQPENDLAVLRAKTIPDDLEAATMRSTADLASGDHVIAVGFPFGIGPSVSEGVVSGLKRQFRSPDGQQMLTNLIQFDAAANPGNSGGPLVTMDGEVVGIVTAILNPNRQRVFIGIGFAVPIENAAAAAGMPPF